MEVNFTIYGEPKGKGRPRFNTKTGHAITPKDTVNYETLVHMEYLSQCGNAKFPDDAMLDMNKIAYRDDTQIVDCQVRKFYSDNPRVEVRILDIKKQVNN